MGTFSFLMFAVFGITAAYLGFNAGYKRWRKRRAIELHACTCCPPADDASESASRIHLFLSNRLYKCDLMDCTREEVLGFSYQNEKDYISNGGSWTELIRLAHALGCEVVVRKVTDEPLDIERSVDSEVRKRMREEWRRAQDKYYDYNASWRYRRHDEKRKTLEDFYEEGGVMDTLHKAGKI